MNMMKLKQWTGEKMGMNEKTKESDEFTALQEVTDAKKGAIEGLESAVILYIAQTEKKKGSTEGSKTKLTPIENLGASMVSFGNSLGDRSLLGQSMVKMGECQEKIARSLEEFIHEIKDPFARNINELKRQLDEYHHLKKKIKSRRLDYDSKATRVRSSKKEKPELEEEALAAQIKYEDTYDDVLNRMIQLEDDEDMYLEDLSSFFQSELAYHRKAVATLEEIAEWMESSTQMKRKSARERFNIEVPERRRNHSPYSEVGGSIRRTSTYRQPGSERSPSQRPARRPYDPDVQDDDRSDTYSQAPSRLDDDYEDDARSFRTTGSRSRSRAGSSNRRPSVYSTASGHETDPFDRPAPPSQPREKEPVREPARPPPPPRAAPPRPKYHKAVYEFDSGATDELAFQEGDLIAIVEELPDEGWWMGEMTDPRTGRVTKGLFPVNYTEECAEEELPPYVDEEPEVRPALPSRAPSFAQPSPSTSSLFYDTASPSVVSTASYASPVVPSVPQFTRSSPVAAAAAAAASRANVVPQTAISAAGHHRAPPPPPPASVLAAAVPASSAGMVKATRVAAAVNRPTGGGPSASADAACSTCGCDDYSPNVFRKNYCNNCFHCH